MSGCPGPTARRSKLRRNVVLAGLAAALLINATYAIGDDHENAPPESAEPASQSPALFDVDEEAAVRALERSLIQINALLLSPGQVEFGVGTGFGLNRQSSSVLVQDTNDASLSSATTEWRTESTDIQVDVQFGLPYDLELDLTIPVSSVRSTQSIHSRGFVLEDTEDTSTGIGDLRLVLLRTLAREKGYRPDLIAFLAVDGDTAESTRPPVGSGGTETTIGVNATRRLDPLIVTGGLDHTFATRANGIDAGSVTRLALGTLLAASPDTALQFQIVETFREKSTLDGRDLPPGSDLTATLELGFSSVVSRSVSLSGSVATTLSGEDAYHAFFLSLSKRLHLSTMFPTSVSTFRQTGSAN